MSAPAPTPRILLIEDDRDTREAVAEFIEDEGFSVQTARSVNEALALVDKHSFSLVLADVWDGGVARWPEIEQLVGLSDPTPVAACSASRVRPPPELSPKLSFFLEKPFLPERLLQLLSKYGGTPHSVERYRGAAAGYFEALSAKDWARLSELCSEDVTYYFPTPHPKYGRKVSGRQQFVDYSKETFGPGPFADARFQLTQLSPLESGVLADWASEWNLSAARPNRSEGSIVMRFEGEKICRLGIRMDVQKWI